MLVMRLKAKQVIPQCRAVMISCTVDIPIASTPIGSTDTTVDTFAQDTGQTGHALGHILGYLQHARIVRFGHAEKPWPEPIIVRTEQWTVAGKTHQIDVILNEHDIADVQVAIGGTGRICDDQMCTAD
uniref:Uncharacterized protein n=1 Tax=Anopheles culicifacies TaxID=139723 RepID=A0A182MBL7_9DIPT